MTDSISHLKPAHPALKAASVEQAKHTCSSTISVIAHARLTSTAQFSIGTTRTQGAQILRAHRLLRYVRNAFAELRTPTPHAAAISCGHADTSAPQRLSNMHTRQQPETQLAHDHPCKYTTSHTNTTSHTRAALRPPPHSLPAPAYHQPSTHCPASAHTPHPAATACLPCCQIPPRRESHNPHPH